MLERLTFVLGADAGVDVEDCLDAVFRCLRLNEEAKRLREVVVVYNLAPEAPRLDILENTLEELRALCSSFVADTMTRTVLWGSEQSDCCVIMPTVV